MLSIHGILAYKWKDNASPNPHKKSKDLKIPNNLLKVLMIMDYENIEEIIPELKELSKFNIKDPKYKRILENAEYFEAKCNYLEELKNVNNSEEVKESLALNTAFKNYYYKKIALYSRYFINVKDNKDKKSLRYESRVFIKKD